MPHGITQYYLPPGRGDIPAFTPAEAGTRLSDPGGMQGWVDLVDLGVWTPPKFQGKIRHTKTDQLLVTKFSKVTTGYRNIALNKWCTVYARGVEPTVFRFVVKTVLCFYKLGNAPKSVSPGLRPGPHWGKLTALPQTPSWWKGGLPRPPQEPHPLLGPSGFGHTGYAVSSLNNPRK